MRRMKQAEITWLEAPRWRTERERKVLYTKVAPKEKIIPLVIYIFHKYSLLREKVEERDGRVTSWGEGKKAKEKSGRGYLVEEETRNRARHKSPGFRRVSFQDHPLRKAFVAAWDSNAIFKFQAASHRPSSRRPPLTESEEHRTIFALLLPEVEPRSVKNFKEAFCI